MKFFIIITLALCLYIILDILLNNQMWEANTVLTVYLQEHQFPGEKELFLFFSYSLFAMPGIALIAFLFFDNKLGALLYACLIQAVFAENSILKNIYHQARPYFIEDQIQPYECNKEYGKPSGHAMSSSAMCFLVPCIIFPVILKDQSNYKYPFYFRVIIISIVTAWTFMTGLSRVFMGVHSFGQILLGWVYTAYTIIIYNQITLLFYICVIFTLQFPIIVQQSIKIYTSRVSSNVIKGVGLFAFGWTCLSILLFEFNHEVFLDESEVEGWLNALYQKCENQTTHYNINSPQVLHNICFSLSLYIWFPFSFLLGIKLSKGIYNENQFSINYKLLNFWQKLSRVLIFLLLLSTLVPIILIKYQNTYAEAFGKILPISILSGLIITYIYTQYQLFHPYSQILNYFKLTIEGDFIQISPSLVSTPEGYKASELGQLNF